MDRPNSVAPLAWLRATPTGSNGMWRNQCCAECRLCVWLMLEDMPLLGYTSRGRSSGIFRRYLIPTT